MIKQAMRSIKCHDRWAYLAPEQLSIEPEALNAASLESNPDRAVMPSYKGSEVMCLLALVPRGHVLFNGPPT